MARNAGLDVPGIVKAALAIADRDGLSKLTMRRLSAELGVTPMAIYHHVNGKDELLDLVIDESIGQVYLDEGSDTPEAAMLDWFVRLHELLTDHPSLAQATAGRQIVGPQARQAGLALSRMAERVCHDADRAAEVVVAGFWLTLGSGLHRASRHPDGYGAALRSGEQTPLLDRVLVTAGQSEQFHRSLTLLVHSHLFPK